MQIHVLCGRDGSWVGIVEGAAGGTTVGLVFIWHSRPRLLAAQGGCRFSAIRSRLQFPLTLPSPEGRGKRDFDGGRIVWAQRRDIRLRRIAAGGGDEGGSATSRGSEPGAVVPTKENEGGCTTIRGSARQ